MSGKERVSYFTFSTKVLIYKRKEGSQRKNLSVTRNSESN